MRSCLLPLAAMVTVLTACSEPASNDDPVPIATEPTAAIAPGASAPATAAAIPERFRGVWDNIQGSCNPASDLRMEIGAVSIEFYESLGAVTGVTVESPDSIVVDLAMEGEGERWTRKNRYALSENGATLTPSDLDVTSTAPIPRKRCAT